MRITDPSAGDTPVNTYSVIIGGTGQTTAQAALSALNGVPLSQLGENSGPAQLTSAGVVDPNKLPITIYGAVSISGPSTITINVPTTFVIEDFHSFITYTLVPNPGCTAVQVDEIITVTGTVLGNTGFKLNNKLVKLTVV